MLQTIAWQVTIACVVVLILIFVYVGLNSREKSEGAADSVSRFRGWVFWILVVAFVPIIGYTLRGLPYAPAPDATGEPVIVKAVGYQWRWDIEPARIPANRPIAFQVTSNDVNHGFAVFDENLKIIAQTQAMPGYTNVLHMRFDRPGTYRILCLEYCGLAHHKMMAELTVTEAE